MSDLVIPTISGLEKAPRKEPRLVADELVDDQTFAITDWADIRPSYTNRKRFNQAALEQLAANIKEVGIVQPILIRPVTPTAEAPQKYEIVAGERRWRAGNIAGLLGGPTIIRTLTDLQAREIQLLENLQREDPHPMEEAEGFQELMLNAGYTADRLVDKLKKSRSYIYGRLKLCALTTEVREQFLDDTISPSTALLIARIPVPVLQIKALAEISAPTWQGTGQPMPYRAALQHIQARYMVDLTRALFKLSDATLLPLAGACTKCPKKSGNQPEVFDDIKSADVCTDPDCYAEKRMAHDAQTIAAAAQGGPPVYEGEEGALWHHQNTNNRHSEFVTATSPLWVFERNAPETNNYGNAAKFLETGLLPEPAWYVKQQDGQVIPFYDKAPIQTLLEAAGACETVEVYNERMAAIRAAAAKKEAAANTPAKLAEQEKKRTDEVAAQKKFALDKAHRTALYKQMRAKGANGLTLGSMREFTKIALVEYGLPATALADTYTFDASNTESIHAYIDQASVTDLQLLLVDSMLGSSLDAMWQTEFEEEDATLHAMARHEGIDPDAVRLQLEMESIAFENVEAHHLSHLIEHAPGRLNDLSKFVLGERPLMLKPLEAAANALGWFYAPGQVWLRASEPSAPAQAQDRQQHSDDELDESAADLADQINLTPEPAVATEVDAPAAADTQPAPAAPQPAARKTKPKKPAPWPWPKSSDFTTSAVTQ